MTIFRTIIFWILFFIITPICFLYLLAHFPFSLKRRIQAGSYWSKSILWLLKYIIGLDYKVEGSEKIDTSKPALICCKHQSAYETYALQRIFPKQVFVMKKELIYLPLIGWGFHLIGSIFIDRHKKSNKKHTQSTLQQIVEQGENRKNEGMWISIFPEGTRHTPGTQSKYKIGSAIISKKLDMAIYPVAVNSGHFWPKNSFLKYPGTVTFVICDPIKPSFGEAEEILNECKKRIEKEQIRIDNI